MSYILADSPWLQGRASGQNFLFWRGVKRTFSLERPSAQKIQVSIYRGIFEPEVLTITAPTFRINFKGKSEI